MSRHFIEPTHLGCAREVDDPESNLEEEQDGPREVCDGEVVHGERGAIAADVAVLVDVVNHALAIGTSGERGGNHGRIGMGGTTTEMRGRMPGGFMESGEECTGNVWTVGGSGWRAVTANEPRGMRKSPRCIVTLRKFASSAFPAYPMSRCRH